MAEVSRGHYYQKQLGCPSRIISWSHGARFRQALALAGSYPTDKILDYGCGDGTFLGFVAERFAQCVGADISTDQLDDCRQRFRHVANVRFCSIFDLSSDEHTKNYRVVTCMETLEHCTDRVVEIVLADLHRLCRPDGMVLISVPIEIGPTFLIKKAVRTLAAWRGLSDYHYYQGYTFRNALRMIFATAETSLDRPTHGEPGAEEHSHYGFNWRRLRKRVSQTFRVERTLFSPIGWLGGWISSQAWFVCRP